MNQEYSIYDTVYFKIIIYDTVPIFQNYHL